MGYELTVYVLTAIYLAGISVQDIQRREISNAAPLVIVLASPFISSSTGAERIIGLFALLIPLAMVSIITNGFGMGDVKLCAAFGWTLGAVAAYGMLAAALFGAVVVCKVTKEKSLPLAPFISGAGMAAVILKEVILRC